jgi:cephalosporin-C deacetylase-like acetyl esterase/lysophospholipase L1-like esterase
VTTHFEHLLDGLKPAAIRASGVVAVLATTIVLSLALGLHPPVKVVPLRSAEKLTVVPYKVSGIYGVGEKIGWTVSLLQGAVSTRGGYTYTIKKNNQEVIKTGSLDFSAGRATIETTLDEPAMVYVNISPHGDSASASDGDIALGAAVAPERLQLSVPRPADFDSFWESKIKMLNAIPENAVLTPGDSGKPDVEYATIKMDHVNGAHVYGQIAKPRRPGPFPALLILQWASPPYPLQKQWVTDRAAEGWLVLNIEPHDVLPDQPKEYYDALPQAIKNYQSIGMDDRDKSYFLQMYLADYRAADYLASRPDWDGKTLVVMGTSMGGQQSLCVAGLHPKITHLIVNEPAGCDTNGTLHGRRSGYPNFPSTNPKIMDTALYFDAVNFASHIKATCLVAMGFVDTVAPPVGIWIAFNQIKGPKEAAPMVDSPHNHLATPAQQRPYTSRSAEWLDSLARSGHIKLNSGAAADLAKYDDHQNMMDQLGIKSLRRGPDPNNQATFDEATANPYKDSMPDVLKMKNGKRVTRLDQWPRRRAEIVEDFEREVYGRIPKNVPKVAWEVTATTPGDSGGIPTVTKTLVGHVDNSAYPQITVNIQAAFTVPASAAGPVPVMTEFGFGGRGPRRAPAGTPWTEQAIAKGWGYGSINPGSIQPDNNQLRSGIIGLTNKGQPRKPDDWGALRAWQWGVSRLIDYFESNPDSMVDPKKVGIEGLSRYGKAAIVTEAFDERIAVGLIGSSGEGGVKLHRHIYGEAVENLAGGEYYWMAGNFIKYGASDPLKTAADIPVDSHELIALCAPRPCFISYGTVENGDAKWVDAHGSFMAGVLAGPVYRLLGKKDFGTPGNYLTDPMPPLKQLIGGELAWRQHEGGHDVTPNWPAFFDWVGNYVKSPGLRPVNGRVPADQPAPRTDSNSQLAHAQLLEKAKKGGIDVYFEGDSITRRWGASDDQYKAFLDNWRRNFFGWNAADFGWGGDTTQNILWRLNNGELDNVNPKVIVLLAGTNNVGNRGLQGAGPGAKDPRVADITMGIKAILGVLRQKAPAATIVLMGIMPRNDNPAVMPIINEINANIAGFADGKRIRYLNINDKLADNDGKLFDGMAARDGLHLDVKGYQLWADALKPIFTELLGPPANTDHAPPPTGDPSAVHHSGATS